MKALLCKFANWMLRKCTAPIIGFEEDLYINGKTYKLIEACTEVSPDSYVTVEFKIIGDRQKNVLLRGS